MYFINKTPFNAASFFIMDRTGAETLLIILKGTWSIEKKGKISIADQQMPIQLSPAYNGDPGSSSLRYDTDIVLEKPGTDCVLIGHAWAPKVGVPHVDVTFAVGSIRSQARVFGERKWAKRRFGGTSISRGVPFEKLPLLWEHAFGGADTSCQDPADHEFCLENPVGRGMVSSKSNLIMDSLLLPNIENPADLIQRPGQRPKPCGFGMIPPYWQPRAGYAGTYDDSWRMSLNPLPPADLNPRFYLSSAPGLCSPEYLAGTEQVRVEGACNEGMLNFELPGIRPEVSIRCRQNEDFVPLKLDTIIVEPDEARFVLVWRAAINVHGKAQEIGMVRVQL
jgi:hypothetical protein